MKSFGIRIESPSIYTAGYPPVCQTSSRRSMYRQVRYIRSRTRQHRRTELRLVVELVNCIGSGVGAVWSSGVQAMFSQWRSPSSCSLGTWRHSPENLETIPDSTTLQVTVHSTSTPRIPTEGGASGGYCVHSRGSRSVDRSPVFIFDLFAFR